MRVTSGALETTKHDSTDLTEPVRSSVSLVGRRGLRALASAWSLYRPVDLCKRHLVSGPRTVDPNRPGWGVVQLDFLVLGAGAVRSVSHWPFACWPADQDHS